MQPDDDGTRTVNVFNYQKKMKLAISLIQYLHLTKPLGTFAKIFTVFIHNLKIHILPI